MNAGETCSTCRFWHEDPAQCRRYPPVVPAGGCPSRETGSTYWPRTSPGDWCGEWAAQTAGAGFAPEPELDPETDLRLRNASAAQALLVLPEEQRERLLQDILTDEEREGDAPPDDFHERVMRYLGRTGDDA